MYVPTIRMKICYLFLTNKAEFKLTYVYVQRPI